MCGIAGIFLTPAARDGSGSRADGDCGGSAPLNELMQGMAKCLQHRGPDDKGYWVSNEDGIGLSHTRLAILDLSSAGHQPMLERRTRNVLTFNGEIYNYRDLQPLLETSGDPWTSQSDTEVILRAYARWGKGCLEHFRGMFAFALWDARQRTLFLARDRFGIKPLYYYAKDGLFIFASEVRTLLESELVPRRIDPIALNEYLTYQSVPAPRTLIEGVRALPPGTWLTVNGRGEIEQNSYWSLLDNASVEAEHDTEAHSRRRVGELMRESVAYHMVSDVPVAAFLSGGIDSGIVTALMAEAGHTPQTFSVIFTEGAYTEARYARQVAAHLQTAHTEILLTEQKLLDQLPGALSAMDQPTGDGVNSYVIARAVSSAGVKVALSGLGGDELFAGYPSFTRLRRADKYLRLWGHAPAAFRSLAAKTIETLGGASIATSKTASMLRTNGSTAAVHPLLRQVLSPMQRRALLRPRFLKLAGAAPDPYTNLLTEAFARAPHAGSVSRVSYAEARTYMHDVLLRDTDQMSMAHALEVRVPLLDHKLAEYVVGLPDALKYPNGTPKRVLVESLGKLLPQEILERPKQGFELPFDPWMRGALRKFCEDRLSPERVEQQGIMRAEEVQKLWKDFLERRSNVSWSRLWVLVVLEDWLERNRIVCDV